MIFSSAKKWNTDFAYTGLLYFAHRCEEMLFHYSDDLFKIPITNTHLLAKEYCDISKQDYNADIKSNNLCMIIDELIQSIQNDIVIKECWGNENIQRVKILLGQSTDQDKLRTITLVCSVLNNRVYYNWCKQILIELVKNPKEKEKIELVTQYIIPELIDYGYSPEYIFYITKLAFFQNRVTSLTVLDHFFSSFTFNEKEYNVYLAVSKEILTMKKTIEKRMKIVLSDDGNFSKLYTDNGMKTILIPKVKALDETCALNKALNYTDLILQFYSFVGNRKKFHLQDKGLVFDFEQRKYIEVRSSSHNLHAISLVDNDSSLDFIESAITLLFNGHKSNFVEIYKAIELHNAALSSKDHKSSFLSLWSILEVICCTNRNGSKSDLIIKFLIPILQMDYISTMTLRIKEMLENCLGDKYNEFLSKIEETNNVKDKILYFTVLDKYEALRIEICNLLADYPIVINRMFVLNKIMKSKSSYLGELMHLGNSLEYQIKRMYRARNMIVHMGEKPNNLQLLCEYLHIYVDAIIFEVLARLMIYKNEAPMDSILMDIVFTYSSFIDDVKVDNQIDKDFLSRILHPSNHYSISNNV